MTSERVAIVTGGSRGIGRGIALALAGRGWHVAVSYRSNKAAAERTQKEIEALGTSTHIVRADMASRRELERLVTSALDRYGRIDLLVNNAGVGPRKRVDMLQVSSEPI